MALVSLEQEVDQYLKSKKIKFYNNTNHPNRLDFTIILPEYEKFYLEVKEKRQHTKTSQWPSVDIPESELFILDDLSARKILKMAPNSGLLVRSNITGRYYFYDVVTLWSVPRLRVNRALNREETVIKGKWMLDLRNAVVGAQVADGWAAVLRYLRDQRSIFTETACYGDFFGESIGLGGEIRTREFKIQDYNSTR